MKASEIPLKRPCQQLSANGAFHFERWHMPPVAEHRRGNSEAPGGQSPNASTSVHHQALCNLQLAVIVAMAVVPMVQVTGNEMVDVVTVPHGFVITSVNVPVGGVVSATGVT